mmetsp:Transcript_9761/g.21437  ORF Transcript_9761/g.21437 Transcript_9761/m.21437 type:complete len:624 (-) Transcript_9761:140-2011(-)|eukprot:CAMPEP_0206420976 /NCGR_PEP_ID=MMETSP0324_2-20121206/1185_1 /ASSEMBLY_ACC=CAM_ASM_000836 /TAXON_ID=2866 /ORGANISM="Crypthecodinium cohnii, Strain Seligo" /LENGTH=623 /DNA_ID=CAMNT_0053885007 /DNA_START=28 /DNA_END=1899 /DNA_ORIENTATION=+
MSRIFPKCGLLATLAVATLFAGVIADGVATLPEVSYEALLPGCPRAAAAANAALRTVGGLTLTGVPEIATTEETLHSWAACLEPTSPIRERALQRALGDLHRVSVTSKMKLSQRPAPWPQCPGAEMGSVQMRLGVHRAIEALTGALKEAGDSRQATVLQELVQNATHLEHLHRYEERPPVRTDSFSDLPTAMVFGGSNGATEKTSLKALDMHTDAGLLLAFVPPTAAAGRTEESLVTVEMPGDSRPRRLSMPEKDSVVIFAGAASTLLGDVLQWRPMPHALSLKSGFDWRAWYGVMLLLPETASVQSQQQQQQQTTFGEYWSAAREYVIENPMPNSSRSPSLSCGDGRLLSDAPDACGKGEMECWMTCMSVAGLDSCAGGEWERSSIAKIATYSSLSVQCLDATSGKAWPSETGNMCPKCKPVCGYGDSAPSPSPSPSPLPTPPPTTSTDFCVPMSGDQGTTMYMDGFQWTAASPDATCLTFLFKSWILDTKWKFILACVGAVLLGLSIEVINAVRRRFAKKKNSAPARWMTYLLQAVTLLLAYIIMLLIMTYSLELFLASILGLALGPVLGACTSRGSGNCGVQDPTLRENLAPGGEPGAAASSHQGGAPCCRAAQGLDPQV